MRRENNDDAMGDKILGCMLGGAVGDALGYPIEFDSYQEIVDRYGKNGLSEYQLDVNGVAEISDDTQMSLFTAAGCLLGMTRGHYRGIMGRLDGYCRYTYLNWLDTQNYKYEDIPKDARADTWLTKISGLYSRRAPGNTCMTALFSIQNNRDVVNDSCGCGGVMRTAPIALISMRQGYAGRDRRYIAHVSAMAARITHKHPLGFLPSAVLSYVLCELLACGCIDRESLIWAFDTARRVLPSTKSEDDGNKYYGELWPKEVKTLQDLMKKATYLAQKEIDDVEAIKKLGQGWTGHEALAIAQYCAIKHYDDFGQAVTAAVNHSGDSDSTGAICGNIMGAFLGVKDINNDYLDKLELKEIIEEMAGDIDSGVPRDDFGPEEARWEYLYECMQWKPKAVLLEEYRKRMDDRRHEK